MSVYCEIRAAGEETGEPTMAGAGILKDDIIPKISD